MTTIEKIRAEIEEKQKNTIDWSRSVGLIDALEIIDKYAEQEPTDEMVHVETLHQVMWERDIAIEQLRELGYGLGQKIEPCDDVVSRQAVLDVVEREPYKGDALSEIEKLPSVIPQEQAGHWISHREHCENLGVMPSGLGAYEWCSNCDSGIDVREWHRNNYNYCPKCGAKMVEQKETETWHGIHAQITAPKGTFERIFNEADDDYDI